MKIARLSFIVCAIGCNGAPLIVAGPDQPQPISPIVCPELDDCISLYVADNGDDQNQGTRQSPLKTLDRAVAVASMSISGGVAQRRYVRVSNARPVAMQSATLAAGISIYGGYDADWTVNPQRQTDVIVHGRGLVFDSGTLGNELRDLTLVGDTDTDTLVEARGNATLTHVALAWNMRANHPFVSRGGDVSMTDTFVTGAGVAVDIQGGNLTFDSGGVDAMSPTMGGVVIGLRYEGQAGQHFILRNAKVLATDGSDIAGLDLGGQAEVEIERNTIDVQGSVDSIATGIRGSAAHENVVGNLFQIRGAVTTIGHSVGASGQALVNNIFALSNVTAVPTTAPIGILLVAPGQIDLVNNTVTMRNGGVAVDGDGRVRLYNNLLITTDGVALHLTPALGASSFQLFNNALTTSQCAFRVGADCVSDIDSCAFTGCKHASATLVGDCQASVDLHLPSSSLCKGAGTDPKAVVPRTILDCDGQARPLGAWDIGADEIPD